jgi:transcriptional regulator NrdR family protein
MKCPLCGANNDVVTDSRVLTDGLSIRRRRACHSCGRRFTTRETIEAAPHVGRPRGAAEVDRSDPTSLRTHDLLQRWQPFVKGSA